jgi:phosphoglycolate phosphatase
LILRPGIVRGVFVSDMPPRPPLYRLVVFDMDGTLADTYPWAITVLGDVADRFGFRKVDDAERESLRSLGTREIMRRLEVAAWKLPAISRHVRARKRIELGRIPLFPGVGAMLAELADAGILLAVVSSDDEENVRQMLGPANAQLIRFFACSAPLFGKASKIRAVLRRSGVPPGEVLCVGDETRDAEAARAVGAAFGAVTWGFAAPEALGALRPDLTFANVGAIVDAVARVPDQFDAA